MSIDPAKFKVMLTRITDMMFGRMCLNAILLSLTPIAFAATTNSFSRSASTCPRTIRASPVQLSKPKIVMIISILAFSVKLLPASTAERIRANGRNGMEENTSVIRMKSISTQPPK